MLTGRESWDEGYQYWWDLLNVVRLPDPISCRGKPGMWQLQEVHAKAVQYQVHNLQIVGISGNDSNEVRRLAAPLWRSWKLRLLGRGRGWKPRLQATDLPVTYCNSGGKRYDRPCRLSSAHFASLRLCVKISTPRRHSAADLPRRAGIREEGDMI